MFKPIAKEELVGRTAETRNWGGMIISIIVIILICATIVIVAIFVSDRVHPITPFDFDDIFNSSFKEKPFHFQWLNENVYVSKDENNNIIQRDVKNNSTIVTLLDSRTWNVEGVEDFWISPNGTHILLACHKTIVYRYSYTAVFKVYDISTKDISPAFKPAESLEEENPLLRYASWSPAQDKNQPSLLLVYKNNIYYQEDFTTAKPITTSGKENLIYNGIPDYTFEGDLLSTNNAIYWFEGGNRFVYATFNDTGIDQSSITKYDHLISPEAEFFPYAKPGGSLPTITLHVVDLETYQTVDLKPPSEIADEEYFYKYVVWVNRFLVSVTWLNRAQNHVVLSICGTDTGSCNISMEKSVTNGWVVLRGPPVFADDKTSYAIIWPLPDKDGRDSHYHVQVVTIKPGGKDEMEFWTEGKFEVTKIVAYEKKEGYIYFLANKDRPSENQLYRVSLNGEKDIKCLSCSEEDCTNFEAEKVEASKFILNCRGPGIPNSVLHDFRSKTNYTLESNTELFEAVNSKVYLKQESEVFEVNGIRVPVRILYHNRKDKNRHHPLLIHVLDEPGSQMVKSEFYSGWYSYLASSYHMIIANIDVRGTSGTGQNHMYRVNRNLGTVEVDDLIAITEFLRNSSLGVVSFKDVQFNQNKVALIGSGYGGFLASMAYAKSSFFNCSIALSPVTDWRYHDAVFTEKFMGKPTATDNLQAYKTANVSRYVSQFRNNTFFVAHGMADKSVHFQHSANLVKALTNQNIQFRSLFYPDRGHNLLESDVKKNLYQAMTDFLVDCIKPDDITT